MCTVALLAFAGAIGVALTPWFFAGSSADAGAATRYFTVQTGIVVAVVALVFAATTAWARAPSRLAEFARGVATVDALITGIVATFVIGDASSQPVLHVVVPVVMALWWVLLPPRVRVPGWWAFAFSVHVVAWLVVTLAVVRVVTRGWVPYAIIDPSAPGGWPAVAGWSAAIVALAVAAGALCVVIARAAPWRAATLRLLGLSPTGSGRR